MNPTTVTKLYVGNLPFSAEEAQLKALFGADGRVVTSVHILMDKLTGRSRGFGFVEMATPGDAERAIQALNGHEFMGRPLTVTEARESAPKKTDHRGFRTERTPRGRREGPSGRGGRSW